MSNNRKFNTMRDHVNTIKNEVSYFSSIIVSAQRSRPDIQDIVRSYTETLKGLWNRVNKEVQSAEQVMIQVLRSAKYDAGSQHSSPVEITPDQVKAAHKSQKIVMEEVLKYASTLDEDAMLYDSANIWNTLTSLSARHDAILKDKNINKCFSRVLPSLQAEFEYNERVFQDFGTDLLITLQKLLTLYDGLDLSRFRQNLLQFKTADNQASIRNSIIGPLQEDAEFIDSSLFKKTMKGAEANNKVIEQRLIDIAQNYYEYNKTLIDISTQVMKLPTARSEPERQKILGQIKGLLTSRQDKWYYEVQLALQDDIEKTFPAVVGQPGQQIDGSIAGAGGQYNAGNSQFNGANTQFGGNVQYGGGGNSPFGGGDAQYLGNFQPAGNGQYNGSNPHIRGAGQQTGGMGQQQPRGNLA